MTGDTLRFAKEKFLPANLAFIRFGRVEAGSRRVQFRRGRKVEHILHLRHVTDLHAIDNVRTFLEGVNLIAVEVGRALLELGEVFDGTQTALRAMHLLIEKSAQTDGVEPHSPLLWPIIGIQVELSCSVAIHMAI